MRPEVAPCQAQIAVLVGFVEGRLDGPGLDAALETEAMKAMLGVFEDPRAPASTNHLRRLQAQDRVTLRGLVNSEGIVEQFLQTAGVGFQSARRYGTLYSLILKALPEYLDPPLEYMTEHIVPEDPALSEAQRKRIIKERLKEQFRCLGKPPQWIQSPEWPMPEGRPLVFVGQIVLDAAEFFHDRGAAYLFFDPIGGGFETVAQFS